MSRNILAADSPTFIVLNHVASIDKIGNATTASAMTSLGRTVGVSFRPANPPEPSEFVLHFPDLKMAPPTKTSSRSTRTASSRRTGTSLSSSCPSVIPSSDAWTTLCNFVYSAASTGQPPALYSIPDSLMDVGWGYSAIFSDGYRRFNIVALWPRLASEEYQYDVKLFSSQTWTWTTQPLKLKPPTEEQELWKSVWSHVSTKIITLEGSSVCWVDLSCGILICDNLFCPTSTREITYVPLPKAMIRNKTSLIDTACSFRDVSGYHGNEIRFVHVENMISWGYGYRVSFWTKDISLEERWVERSTHLFSMQYLSGIDLGATVELNLNYVLSTVVPRLSLQRNRYVVHLISKQCSGVVIDVDVTDVHSPKMSLAAHSFCTGAISCDPLSCWLVPSPFLIPGKEKGGLSAAV